MDILVTLDSGYIGPLCVMLYSLCRSNPDTNLRIYVVHSSLTPEDFARVRAAVNPRHCEIVDTFVPKDRFPDLPYSERWPKEACYRIFAAHILPAEMERVLYLDPDMVILNSLEELYAANIDDSYFAACTHMFEPMQIFSRMRLKMSRESVYINSGVMLMNLTLLRREQHIDEVYAYVTANRRRLHLFDQDILNGMYHEKTRHMDPLRYNLDEKYLKLYNWSILGKGKEKITNDWVGKNTAILHFCGKNKPWKPDYKGDFARLFYAPFAEALQESERTITND